jgi:hypothetical protein
MLLLCLACTFDPQTAPAAPEAPPTEAAPAAESAPPTPPAVLADPVVLAPDMPLDAPVAAITAPPDVQASIAATVKKSQGRILSCLERALKEAPTLAGRVSVGWTIVEGRVTESHLVANTTGDDALGGCVVAAVRGFRFDPTVTAEVAEFPWVVSGEVSELR